MTEVEQEPAVCAEATASCPRHKPALDVVKVPVRRGPADHDVEAFCPCVRRPVPRRLSVATTTAVPLDERPSRAASLLLLQLVSEELERSDTRDIGVHASLGAE
jgi:hypothetical protein